MGVGKIRSGTYGIIAEFTSPAELTAAAEAARDAGFTEMDAFSPFPIHGLHEAVGMKTTGMSALVLGGGIIGGVAGFFMCWYANVISYPLNIGGKPFNSWPAFVPIMFELTILFGGLATFGALLFFCGLPNIKKRVVDPSVTRDRFALLIEAPTKPEQEQKMGHRPFSESDAADFLKKTGAKEVRTVYAEGWFE